MPDVTRQLLWSGPEHGDGDTLRRAFRRLTGRDFEPGRCLFEEVASGWTRHVMRDGIEVVLANDGPSRIERVVPAAEGGGGAAG
jgi:hypothetical protein